MLAGASLGAEASSSTKLSTKSSDHSGRSRNGLPCTLSMSSFCLFVFLNCRNWSPSARLRFLLRRVFAEHGVESSRIESCGTDVEDVLVDELESPVDKPGDKTIGT